MVAPLEVEPIVVAAAPVALMSVVPTTVNPPRVTPPVNVVVPVMTALPSTVRSVPTSKVVVDLILPGAMKVAGIDCVIVEPLPVVVIWLAVPARVMLFAAGAIAPPLSPVRVFKGPETAASKFQVALFAVTSTRI